DDVDRLQIPPHNLKQLKPDRIKPAAFHVRITDVQPDVPPGLEHALDLPNDLLHRGVVLATGGVELANVARVGTVVQVRRVRRVNEHEIHLPGQLRRELAGIDTEDVLARRMNIV